MHTRGRQSDDSIRGDGAQWPEHRAQLVRHVLVCDADSFPKVFGAADKALNVSPRVYARIIIRPTLRLKHQLSCGEPGSQRVEARVACADYSHLEGQESIGKTRRDLFTIRTPRKNNSEG